MTWCRGQRHDRRLGLAVLVAAALAQAAFAWSLRDRHPPWDILGPPPGEAALRLMSFGDAQVLYRVLGLSLQHAGDTGGRVTSLRSYDYDHVGGWLRRLDALDPRSDLMPALAAFYFGVTPTPEDAAKVVDYLIDAVRDDPGRWRYLAHGAVIAKHRVKDLDLALRAARTLAALPGDQPVWTRQMPAFVLAEMGDTEQAAAVFAALLQQADDLPPEEVAYMLRMLEAYQAEPGAKP